MSLSETARVEYLIAVAALVYADGYVADSELQVLRALAHVLALPDGAYNLVMASARFPDKRRVTTILDKVKKDNIKYTLLCDAVLVAFADGRLLAAETEEIARFARALGISTAQAGKIARYVADSRDEHKPLAAQLVDTLDDAADHVHPPRGLRALYKRLTGGGKKKRG